MIKTGTVYENSAATLLDQVSFAPETYAIAADIESIIVKSFDTDTDELVKTTNIVVADSVLDDLSRAGWSQDRIGYNVKLPLGGDHWPRGDRVYRVEVCYTPTDGDAIYSLWDLQCVRVRSESSDN